MKTEHLITPPPELVRQWAQYQGFESPEILWRQIATQAARWGADQELEACCEHLKRSMSPRATVEYLRAARRPKPPSLKEQAIFALNEADQGLNEYEWQQRSDTIRRAIEALPD